MKIDFSKVFMDLLTDQPINATKQCVVVDEKRNFVRPEGDPKGFTIVNLTIEADKLTLKDVALQVLFTERQDEKATADEKSKKFLTALKIKDSVDGIVDLKSEEVSKLKELIAGSYATMIAGQAEKFLENPVADSSEVSK